jgi:N-acylglucosamine 2-epimerase
MAYSIQELKALKDFYSNQLLNDTIPFWFPRSIDTEYGGYLLMRDQDGSLIDDDKMIWIQGRAAWMLATLYNTVETKERMARLDRGWVLTFCSNYGFDSDGQMFFHVTRKGEPIRKRRYFFSETFAVIASAACAKATGDQELAEWSRQIFGNCLAYISGEKKLPPKFFNTRPSKGIGAHL